MVNLFGLTNKTAIITGAGSGIGKSIALLFAELGAYIILLDYNENGARETLELIESKGGKGTSYKCDVSDKAMVQETIQKVIQQKHSIDILVNNAGVSHIGNLENTSDEDFERVFNINVKGVYNCLSATIPYMKEKGTGAVLNLASVASTIGISDRFAYSMSKGAVLAMTLSIARDYISYGIRCNCISPGRVHTPFVDDFIKKSYPGKEKEMFDSLAKSQPIGRMGTPEEIAKLALYLCSDDASFVTGSNYAIDGGFVSLK